LAVRTLISSFRTQAGRAHPRRAEIGGP